MPPKFRIPNEFYKLDIIVMKRRTFKLKVKSVMSIATFSFMPLTMFSKLLRKAHSLYSRFTPCSVFQLYKAKYSYRAFHSAVEKPKV